MQPPSPRLTFCSSACHRTNQPLQSPHSLRQGFPSFVASAHFPNLTSSDRSGGSVDGRDSFVLASELPPSSSRYKPTTMLPFSNQRRHSQDDAGDPDPEADHLIPARKRRHRVRVQGRLAVVRSVSTANLRPAASVAPALPSPVAASGTTTPAAPRFESGVAGTTGTPPRRRKSLDDASSDGAEEDDAKETAVRDRQFRGYGIGGAGNISETSDRGLRLNQVQLVTVDVFHV
ncbi:hypothetical protein LZ30DRAFT_323006 [Colletotrichum cereale]|nr:hypothetical protein LZ30DRAFT_323006 [Colletotrichum cereale]